MVQTALRTSRTVKLNAVVAKGKISVASRGSLQVVASNEPEQDQSVTAKTNEHDTSGQPNHSTAPWLKEPSDDAFTQAQPSSDLQVSRGPSMKLIKLMAAAGALTVAAIALAFLQFSGPTNKQTQGQDQRPQTSAVLNAAVASTFKPATRETVLASPTERQSSDLVAQITAGTLAALRTGSAKLPTQASDLVQQAIVKAPTTGQPNALYAMVLHAVQQGQSVQYIDQLVNEAYRAEEIAVPSVLLTAAGKVDTKALLTLFIGEPN